tara:strand:- start:20 stop:682 length:663 start_codon:yes stop_codon:yes gene_type:complete
MAYKDPEKAKARNKAYYQENKEKISAYIKARYQANKEKFKLKAKAYYQENKEKINLRQKVYREANKEKISLQCKAYYQANKEKINLRGKAWYQENKEKRNAVGLAYQKNRLKTDPTYRLIRNMRSRMNHALRGKDKSKSTMQLRGCTIDEFWLHLEKQFQPGMTRENHGFGEGCWHVDHIKPCSSFDLSDPEQQKICFHYTNCQPLWQRDNLSKGAKFNG